jgi:hypothetical protein
VSVLTIGPWSSGEKVQITTAGQEHGLTFWVAEGRASVPDQQARDVIRDADIAIVVWGVRVVAAHADTVAPAIQAPVPHTPRVHILPVGQRSGPSRTACATC